MQKFIVVLGAKGVLGDLEKVPEEISKINDIFFKANLSLQVSCESNLTKKRLLDRFIRFTNKIAIFHFAGHSNSEIMRVNDGLVFSSHIAELLMTWNSVPNLIFINGCSSSKQVEAFHDAGVIYVVATRCAIDDEKASLFSQNFYTELVDKPSEVSIQTAFERAGTKTFMDLEQPGKPRSLGLEEITKDNTSWDWGLYLNPQDSFADDKQNLLDIIEPSSKNYFISRHKKVIVAGITVFISLIAFLLFIFIPSLEAEGYSEGFTHHGFGGPLNIPKSFKKKKVVTIEASATARAYNNLFGRHPGASLGTGLKVEISINGNNCDSRNMLLKKLIPANTRLMVTAKCIKELAPGEHTIKVNGNLYKNCLPSGPSKCKENVITGVYTESKSEYEKLVQDERKRNTAIAILIGYNAALGLAQANEGNRNGLIQTKTIIQKHFNNLGFEGFEYPENPSDESINEFSQNTVDLLNQIEPSTAKAFLLGYYGLITTNTPSIKFDGFDINEFSEELELKPFQAEGQSNYIEQIIEDAENHLSNT